LLGRVRALYRLQICLDYLNKEFMVGNAGLYALLERKLHTGTGFIVIVIFSVFPYSTTPEFGLTK